MMFVAVPVTWEPYSGTHQEQEPGSGDTAVRTIMLNAVDGAVSWGSAFVAGGLVKWRCGAVTAGYRSARELEGHLLWMGGWG